MKMASRMVPYVIPVGLSGVLQFIFNQPSIRARQCEMVAVSPRTQWGVMFAANSSQSYPTNVSIPSQQCLVSSSSRDEVAGFTLLMLAKNIMGHPKTLSKTWEDQTRDEHIRATNKDLSPDQMGPNTVDRWSARYPLKTVPYRFPCLAEELGPRPALAGLARSPIRPPQRSAKGPGRERYRIASEIRQR